MSLFSFLQKRASGPRGSSDFIIGCLPPGERIYAIGDIHGRNDLLTVCLARIDAHRRLHPVPKSTIVFLGDYVDRGPKTKDVIETLISRSRSDNVVLLAGNHEVFMLKACEDPGALLEWLQFGGRETLHSYGIAVPLRPQKKDLMLVIRRALDHVPEEHFEFLRRLESFHVSGTYAFVHAGVRPHVRLFDQTRTDLLQIRDTFIGFKGAHDYMIVHGHTVVDAPKFLPNRIAIDTGAYVSGNLSCLVLEGTSQTLLQS